MKKQMLSAALVLAISLGAGLASGCSQEAPKDALNADVPAGAPPLMPASHQGRFEQGGAQGCYGCHGANEQADPMLKDAPALPADHYDKGDSSTLKLDGGHGQCDTCHVQG